MPIDPIAYAQQALGQALTAPLVVRGRLRGRRWCSWSPEHLAVLRAEYAAAVRARSVPQLALRLERTPSALRQMAKRLGIEVLTSAPPPA